MIKDGGFNEMRFFDAVLPPVPLTGAAVLGADVRDGLLAFDAWARSALTPWEFWSS